MHNTYYIDQNKLSLFLSRLSANFNVFAPKIKAPNFTKEADYSFAPFNSDEALTFNPYRAVEPLKPFFTYPYEKIADYFTKDNDITDSPQKSVILGVKGCDLVGHKIQDFVFLEGVEVDSLYRLRRENTYIISSDCTDFKGVCHCLAWEILPYPVAGFDLNMSPLGEGYLVEVGSKKGEELININKEHFIPAKDTHLTARQVKRENLVDRLQRHILPQNLVSKDAVQKIVKDGYNADTWKEFMLTCVECGGCNLICDTCHCFIIADSKEGAMNRKMRTWDCCLYANYARVAGGANPLKLRAQRLRNRFMKKFDFFVENLNMPACCGCGRCIEVCPGKIDIREVLKDLAQDQKTVT